MIRHLGRRFRDLQGDEGAYAILYAALVVALFASAAMIVDIAQLREDRRANRVLADNAALVAADHLSKLTGIDPQTACTESVNYLESQWGVTSPAAASYCGQFPAQVNDCSAFTSSPVTVTVPVAGRTVELLWPVTDQSLATASPDIRPANLSPQSLDPKIDGDSSTDSDVPCERIAISIDQSQGFSLAPAIGVGGATVHSYSVAINRLVPGGGKEIAALNVLHHKGDSSDCESLWNQGQGQIVVARTTQPDGKIGPGIIAVEGDPSSCQNNTAAITVQGQQKPYICADGPDNGNPGPYPGICNGNGVIESHALDPGGHGIAAYPVDAPSLLAPNPVAEGGTHGWAPVTNLYGCSTSSMCSTSPNYISALDSKYASGVPGVPYTGVDNGLTSSFVTLTDGTDLSAKGWGIGTFTCKGPTGKTAASYYVKPGNWFVSCDDSNNQPGFAPKNTLAMFGGGTIVFSGGIQIPTGGQLSFNVPLSGSTVTPPTVQNTGPDITTSPSPSGDALVYVRGGVSNSGALSVAGTYSLWAPQTFFYLADKTNGFINFGAGGSGSTLLLTAPKTATCATDDEACADAGFKRVVLWSEASSTQTMGGQGNIYLLGVFFTPKSTFDFSGKASYASAGAQVWADKITLSGSSFIKLQPDPNNSVPQPASSSSLIR